MSNLGMNEWLQEGEHSKYQTPRGLPKWVWALIGFAVGVTVSAFFCTRAHASPSCMTHAEAREVWPREYLHWHGDRCWSGHSVRSAHAEMRAVPLPKPKPFMLLLEQSEQPSQEWIYADRWWLSSDEISYRGHWCNRKLSGSWCR